MLKLTPKDIDNYSFDDLKVIQVSDHYRGQAVDTFNSQCAAAVREGYLPITKMDYTVEGSQHTFTQQFAK